jgi:predicted acyl esterase
MTNQRYPLIFREPLPPTEGGYPGFNPRTEKVMLSDRVHFPTMIIDYDVTVTMRDGKKIYINVHRPEKVKDDPSLFLANMPAVDTTEKCPVLIAWGPYGKHGRRRHD